MTHLLDTNSCVVHLRCGQASNITAGSGRTWPALARPLVPMPAV